MQIREYLYGEKSVYSLIFITLTILVLVYGSLFHFLDYNNFDAPSYFGGSRLLFKLPGALDFQSRLSKPLTLIVPGFMEWAFNIHPRFTYWSQNILFFYLCGFSIYKLFVVIFKDTKIAFGGMMVYCTCQPLACFSFLILSDVSGWFFGIYSIYLSIKFLLESPQSLKKLWIIGFIVGIGCLFKESAIVGLIFLFTIILFNPTSIQIKIKQLSIVIIGFLIPFATSFFIIQHFYADSVIKRMHDGYKDTEHDTFMLSQLKQIYRVIDVYWFLFLFGLRKVYLVLKAKHNTVLLESVLLSIVIIGISMQIWPYLLDRILFMLAPFMVIIILYGLQYFANYKTILITSAGIINIGMTYAIYRFQMSGMILIGTVLFTLILGMIIIRIYQKDKTFIKV